jgi:hypothetical protein
MGRRVSSGGIHEEKGKRKSLLKWKALSLFFYPE